MSGSFTKQNLKTYLRTFKNTLRGKATEHFVCELNEKSGKEHVIDFSSYPIKENGKVTRILLIGKDVTEQKETENRYRLITEKTSDLITTSTFTLNPIFTYISPSHKKAIGYESSGLIGKPFFDFVHPDDKKKLRSLLKKYLSAKAKKFLTGKDSDDSEKIEIRFRDKSGNWHYMETTANLIGSEIVSVSRDVTDRKKAEEVIRNSEEKYRTLAESAPVGISVSNAEGVVFEVNPAILKIFGYDSKEEFLKMPAVAYYYDRKDRERFTDLFKQGFVKDFEARFKRKDGTVFWGSVTSTMLTTEAESTMFINVFEDITTRLKTEEKLRESEKKYSGFFKTSRDATFLTSKDGRLIESNNAFIELLGYETKDELLKIRLPEHYENPEDRKRHIQIIEKQGFTKEFPVNLRKKDGSVINTLITSVVIKDENGDVAGFQGTIRDITERKRAEKELKKSEERFKDISYSIADWIWEVDKDGRYTFSSGYVKESLGYEHEELIGKTSFDLMPEDEAKRVGEIFKEIVSKRKPIVDLEKWVLTKEGNKVCLLTNGVAMLGENGELRGYRGVDKDITDRKKADEKLKEKINELERYKNVTVGRELRIIELKKKIKQLEGEKAEL